MRRRQNFPNVHLMIRQPESISVKLPHAQVRIEGNADVQLQSEMLNCLWWDCCSILVPVR
jgi:hypothetical protein